MDECNDEFFDGFFDKLREPQPVTIVYRGIPVTGFVTGHREEPVECDGDTVGTRHTITIKPTFVC